VIGVVSTEDKAKAARANGCMDVILSNEDIPARVRTLTAGEGVPVVFDAVGAATFDASLASLRVRGTLVSFGTASGKVPPFDLFKLNLGGSLSITSAAFAFFVRSRPELLERARDLIDVVLRQAVRVQVNQEFRLADAAEAQRQLEARQTLGASVLVP
jgi:NADPH2:quinone reductase